MANYEIFEQRKESRTPTESSVSEELHKSEACLRNIRKELASQTDKCTSLYVNIYVLFGPKHNQKWWRTSLLIIHTWFHDCCPITAEKSSLALTDTKGAIPTELYNNEAAYRYTFHPSPAKNITIQLNRTSRMAEWRAGGKTHRTLTHFRSRERHQHDFLWAIRQRLRQKAEEDNTQQLKFPCQLRWFQEELTLCIFGSNK